MAKERTDYSRKGEPSQTTEKGTTIPIPKKSEFLDNLKKTVSKKSGTRGAKQER